MSAIKTQHDRIFPNRLRFKVVQLPPLTSHPRNKRPPQHHPHHNHNPTRHNRNPHPRRRHRHPSTLHPQIKRRRRDSSRRRPARNPRLSMPLHKRIPRINLLLRRQRRGRRSPWDRTPRNLHDVGTRGVEIRLRHADLIVRQVVHYVRASEEGVP